MLIKFHDVSWKNFLSTGNITNKIILDKNRSTLISGKNSCGKSTLLDALTYSLFGKPFRNINIPQLVNSINQKNLEVVVNFSIGNNKYRIVRGLKPKIFEVYQNDILLNPSGDNRDYQNILENQILKINYRTFKQVVVLGSATFAPFMQLPAAQRREIIEDILDIRIFSTMNSVLKDYIQKNKDEIQFIENKIDVEIEKTKSQEKLLKTVKDHKQELENSYKEQIQSFQNLTNDNLSKIKKIEEQLKITKDRKDLSKTIKELSSLINVKRFQIKNIEKQLSFINDSDICTHCLQTVEKSHKLEIGTKLITEKEDITQQLTKLTESLKIEEQHQIKIDQEDKIRNNLLSELKSLKNENEKYNNNIKQLNNKIEELKSNVLDIEQEKKKLKEFANNVVVYGKRKNELVEEQKYNDIIIQLLKDNGIKTKIVEQYLPIINTLINKYLNIFDFYASFELNETFNETIKSRFRDDMSYFSYSEGMKKRIDLAILFTFREIAKLKNSLNCNILILDEVLDSSLDNESLEYLMQIFAELKDTNLFVISHRGDQLYDKFHSNIKFELKNDFSVMV